MKLPVRFNGIGTSATENGTIIATVDQKLDASWKAQVTSGGILSSGNRILSFSARNRSASGYVSLFCGIPDGGKPDLAIVLDLVPTWKRFFIPVEISRPGSALNFDIGHTPQTVEIKDVEIFEVKSGIKLHPLNNQRDTDAAIRWLEATEKNLKPVEFTVIFSIFNDSELLESFIKHYLGQGAKNFICVLWDLKSQEEISKRLTDTGCQFKIVFPDNGVEFNGKADADVHDFIRATMVRTEWYVIADLDEFHRIPGYLISEGIAEANACGATVIAGEFLDRLTADGSIPTKTDIENIDAQFPLGSRMTAVITRGAFTKVLAAKRNVEITSGHHFHDGVQWVVFGWAHHFKWRGNILEKAVKRVESYEKQRLFWAAESRRLIEYLSSHGGQIDVSDPRIGAWLVTP
jgi:hypothetical protein